MTQQERLRREHQKRMKAQAMERGINLSDEPPPRGSGMGSGGGGMESGNGGQGY
jgi:hypothetical protein